MENKDKLILQKVFDPSNWKSLPYGLTTTGYPTTKEEFTAYRRYLGQLSLKKWGASLFEDAIDLTPSVNPVEDQYDKWTMSESKRKIMKGLTK